MKLKYLSPPYLFALLKFILYKCDPKINLSGISYFHHSVGLSTKKNSHIYIGKRCYFSSRSLIESHKKIIIGDRVFINRDTMVVALDKIVIGNDVTIAERVSIRDHDHKYESLDTPIKDQDYKTSPIKIEDNCWIGANAIILKGVTVGTHSVIGAGSVITKSIPPFSLAVGNPAKVIKTLK